MIPTTTNSGLHDFVGQNVLAPIARPRLRAAPFSGTFTFIFAFEGKK
jgi:hypothetical protein